MGAIVENVHQYRSPGGLQFGVVDPVVRASVAGAQPAPTALISTISGTNQMTTIALPYPGFTGFLIFLPTGAFTGATGGTSDGTNMAIGKAFTAVVQRALIMVFDGILWYPIA